MLGSSGAFLKISIMGRPVSFQSILVPSLDLITGKSKVLFNFSNDLC